MFARQESAWPILAFLALALMFGVGVASAQTRLRGELGADVGIVDFENQLPSNPDPYAVRRALSDQFLKLGLRGSLYDPQLGFYTLRTRIAGQYYGVRSTTGTTSSYTNPQVTALGVQFGMFPGRRYPLRLYYSWSELTALNYEQENRAVVDQQSPELAAVRRYDSSNLNYGADWRLGMSPTSDLVAEVQHQESTSLRQYDFAEQRDIYVEFLTPSPDPTLPVVRIIVQNDIPEGEVDLLVDGIIVVTLVPEQRFEFQLDGGLHDVQFVPTQFNGFFSTVNVNGDMFWRASFNTPPGRTDIERSENAGRVEMISGRDRRFENRARFSFNDSFEGVIGRSALLLDAENDAGYDWSPQTLLRSTTSWTLTSSSVGAANDQDISNLRQKTLFGYRSFQGSRGLAEHLYDRTRTITGPIDIVTTQNRLRLETGRPWGRFGHRVTLRNLTTHISNSQDYRTLENRSDLQNDAIFYTERFRWRPRSSVLLTLTERKNPDSAFNEFEVREVLEVDRPHLWVLGSVLGTGELGWRRRSESGKIDTTVRLNAGMTVNRDFGPNYRLFVTANTNNETYATRLTMDGAMPAVPRDPQRQRSFRGGLRANPIPEIGFNAAYSYTKQLDQTQTEFRLDLTVLLPIVHVPITTTYSDQRRMITGRADQSTARWETRMAFAIRNIRLQFEHSYIAETLITEDYGLNMFRAEIVRGFSVF